MAETQAPGVKPRSYYQKDRSDFVEWIGGQYRRVLEVGCGAGMNAPLFRRLSAEHIVGIEPDKESATAAMQGFDVVYARRVEDTLDELQGPFDLIVCADVLEHLADPWGVLLRLRQLAHQQTCLAISIPNIRHYRAILQLAFGEGFRYQDEGTFDRTHLRFFTRANIAEMLAGTGWDPSRWSGSRVGRLAGVLHRLAWLGGDRADEFLNYQWYVAASLATQHELR
jgi:2-polyprenyl-3-methyl-5-hydroxy-6-metoxy-1,4-benzoquinol methylase